MAVRNKQYLIRLSADDCQMLGKLSRSSPPSGSVLGSFVRKTARYHAAGAI